MEAFLKTKGRTMNKKYNDFDLSSNDYGIGFTLKGEPFYFDKDDYEKIKNITTYFKFKFVFLYSFYKLFYF